MKTNSEWCDIFNYLGDSHLLLINHDL